MPTLTLDLAEGASPATLPIVQAIQTTPTATPAGQPTQYLIRAVTQGGVQLVRYPKAHAKWVQWVKNDEATAEIDVPLDVDISALDPPNEIQIWRNGHLLFWGRVTRRRVSSQGRTWTLSCRSLLSYFKRRNMDKGGTGLTDLLEDAGNFEGTDLADKWTIGYGLGGSGATATVETAIKLLDDQSAELEGDSTGGDRFLYRRFMVTSTDIGVAVFLSGYLFIASMTGAPYQERGLLIGYYDTPSDLFLKKIGVATIKPTAPIGSWQRYLAVVNIEPGEARVVEARVQIPFGKLYADALRVRVMESFSMIAANAPDGIGWDQVDIAHQQIKFLQGKGFFGIGNNKSDLNIGVSGGPSGVVRHRTYQFFEHRRGYTGPNGTGALDELLRMEDGIDIAERYSPESRWIETAFPRIGSTRSTWRFRWVREITDDGDLPDDRWGIASWDYEDSLDTTANDITELSGWGNGVSREEGGYTNPDSLGGLTLELVETAAQDSPLDALDGIAEKRGAQLERRMETPTFTIKEPRDPATNEVTTVMVGVLMPGDVIPLNVVDGGLSMVGDYQVARVRLDCTTDLLAVVPNPEPD